MTQNTLKTVVIGDIHGRTTWKEIVDLEPDANVVVFMGDYFDSRDRLAGAKQQMWLYSWAITSIRETGWPVQNSFRISSISLLGSWKWKRWARKTL